MKKVVSVILSLLLTVTVVPAGALTNVQESYNADGNIQSLAVEDATTSPFESFKIEDVAIPEKEIGLYNHSHYDMWSLKNRLKYTAKLKDGRIIEGTANTSLEIDGEYYSIDINDNQSDEPWELEGTYTATATLCGADYPFNIKIVENPKKVVDFKAEDSTVMYGLNDWTGNNYPISSPEDFIVARDFSLTLADGSVLHSKNGSILFEDIFYTLEPEYTWDNTAEDLWELGSTFTVTATFQDFSDTFEMTVVESCIENIEFSDVTVIENANITDDPYHDPVTGEWKDYSRYEYYPAYTVTFKDGKKQTFDYPEGLSLSGIDVPRLNAGAGGWDSYGCFPVCTDSQEESPWEAGKTYTVPVSLLGFSDTVKVTVIENPVVSIVPDNMTVLSVEYYGDLYDSWYFYSNDTKKLEYYDGPAYTVTLRDGTVLKTESGISGVNVRIYDEIYYIYCKCSNGSLYNAQLEYGSYDLPVTIYAFGEEYKLDVPVEVMTEKDFMDSRGVAGIEIKDIRLFIYSFYIDGSPCYQINPEFDLIMKDGSKSKPEDFFAWPSSLEIDLDYDEIRNWKVGEKHSLTGSWCGLTDEFSVTMIENPIEKVINTDIICINPDEVGLDSIIFNKDKEYAYSDYGFLLNTAPISFRLKDGTTVSTKGGNDGVTIYNNRIYAQLESEKGFYEKNKRYDAKILGFDVHITFPEGMIPGDLDGTGVVDVADIMTLKNLIMSGRWNEKQLAAGDIDGNGSLTVSDILAIKNIIMS